MCRLLNYYLLTYLLTYNALLIASFFSSNIFQPVFYANEQEALLPRPSCLVGVLYETSLDK